MKEEFLHYIWKYALYSLPLKLTTGEQVQILSPGDHNQDAGPDFFNAKIKIENTIWAGNVEMHVKASDWHKHNHSACMAYDNIILHVVAENDDKIKRKNGKLIPALELRVPANLYEQYLFLMQNSDWVPCETFLTKVDEFTIFQWKETLLVERLAQKAEIIDNRFKANKNNWEETFYQSLAANFGFKTNAQPFEMLAKNLPLIYLGKHKDQLSLIEAMLFGQSGLLDDKTEDTYIAQLHKDYMHLSAKFNLSPMSGHLWKFMRLRPANFPTLRIAQFAALIHKSNALFSKIIESKNLNDVKDFFAVQASVYWNKHYTFNKESEERKKKLGKSAFENILINTITPVLFYYGQQKNKPAYTEKALKWLSEITAENNSITRNWKTLDLNSENAFDSQALIQLKNVYCKKRRCLQCRIGNQVIKHTI